MCELTADRVVIPDVFVVAEVALSFVCFREKLNESHELVVCAFKNLKLKVFLWLAWLFYNERNGCRVVAVVGKSVFCIFHDLEGLVDVGLGNLGGCCGGEDCQSSKYCQDLFHLFYSLFNSSEGFGWAHAGGLFCAATNGHGCKNYQHNILYYNRNKRNLKAEVSLRKEEAQRFV